MGKLNTADSHAPHSSRSLRAAVIPARNEALTISQVVRGALSSVGRVIVVDDGSTDETGAIAVAAGADVIRNEEAKG